MAANEFGNIFRITSFGESHGECVGVLIDGCPAGFPMNLEKIQALLTMRRPGQSQVTTSRKEQDKLQVKSGIFEGKTTGAPILMEVANTDVDSTKYYALRDTPRPSHADYPAFIRYGGNHDFRGGGRFSGRITAGIVMAGGLALQILDVLQNIRIGAHVVQVGKIKGTSVPSVQKILNNREQNAVRTADLEVAPAMEAAIEDARSQSDSIGGIVECIIENVPAGIGNPIFDTLEGVLSKALFAIPAIKGVEFGAGFRCVEMRGSEHNDPYRYEGKTVVTTSNNAGGILGGISTGMPIVFRVAIKPTASIGRSQQSINLKLKKNVDITVEGRHDPCIAPRAVPVIDCMSAIVLLDLLRVAGTIPAVVKVVPPI